MIADREAFILANTRPQHPPHTPELVLHLADEITPIWRKTEEELGQMGLPPPFWAFAWAGGQALARYVLDNPDIVDGWPARGEVWTVKRDGSDLRRGKRTANIIWGNPASVLVGDPGRTYFPKDGMVRLAEYQVATTRELEDMEVKKTGVWMFQP